MPVARELGEPRPLRGRMRQRLRRDAGSPRGDEHPGAAGRGVERGRVEHQGHELHGCRGRPARGIRPAERGRVEQPARRLRGCREHHVRGLDREDAGLVVGRPRHGGIEAPARFGRGIRVVVAHGMAREPGDLGAGHDVDAEAVELRRERVHEPVHAAAQAEHGGAGLALLEQLADAAREGAHAGHRLVEAGRHDVEVEVVGVRGVHARRDRARRADRARRRPCAIARGARGCGRGRS